MGLAHDAPRSARRCLSWARAVLGCGFVPCPDQKHEQFERSSQRQGGPTSYYELWQTWTVVCGLLAGHGASLDVRYRYTCGGQAGAGNYIVVITLLEFIWTTIGEPRRTIVAEPQRPRSERKLGSEVLACHLA
jgi:hypothetical protein